MPPCSSGVERDAAACRRRCRAPPATEPASVAARGGSRSDSWTVGLVAALHRADAERHVGAEMRRRDSFCTPCEPGISEASTSGSSSIAHTAPAARRPAASPSPRSVRSPGLPPAPWRRRARRRRRLVAVQRSAASLAGVSGRSIVVDAERVGHRIGEADRRGHAVALADALGAERRERRRALDVQDAGAPAPRSRSAADSRRRCRTGRRRRRRSDSSSYSAAPSACAKPPRTWPSTMPGCRTRPQSCIVT